MDIDRIEGLRHRIQIQQQDEQKLLRDGEEWYISALGNYDNDYLLDSFTPPSVEVQNSKDQKVILRGYEVFLYETAKELLQTKKQGPVIMLDAGGGTGITWNRLAVALRDEIESSRLALVVSNLKATPQEQLEKFAPKTLRQKVTIIESQAEMKAAEGLVRYVSGPFFSLRMHQISLPNGQNIRLEGKTDFINEKLSLTAHTLTPELDVPVIIGNLLSPYGIYSIHPQEVEFQYVTRGRNPQTVAQRNMGVPIAHRALEENFGLQKVTNIETGPHRGELMEYTIFRGPLAPAIRV